MKPRKESNPFEGLQGFKDRQQENRQAAYENKVCKKIIRMLFEDDEQQYADYTALIKRSETPLLELQPVFEPFAVRSHRMNSWGFQDLFLRPSKCEVWNTFAQKGGELAAAFPDHIPALIFYNSAIEQDMVVHAGISTKSPPGHFRLMRNSNSESGGIVVDTLPGFLKIL
jgi:hypothetical protein|tara:strand:+ start:1264 stop:1773 length:510 start_codon:yes stop_codon:yes gene_type:complete